MKERSSRRSHEYREEGSKKRSRYRSHGQSHSSRSSSNNRGYERRRRYGSRHREHPSGEQREGGGGRGREGGGRGHSNSNNSSVYDGGSSRRDKYNTNSSSKYYYGSSSGRSKNSSGRRHDDYDESRSSKYDSNYAKNSSSDRGDPRWRRYDYTMDVAGYGHEGNSSSHNSNSIHSGGRDCRRREERGNARYRDSGGGGRSSRRNSNSSSSSSSSGSSSSSLGVAGSSSSSRDEIRRPQHAGSESSQYARDKGSSNRYVNSSSKREVPTGGSKSRYNTTDSSTNAPYGDYSSSNRYSKYDTNSSSSSSGRRYSTYGSSRDAAAREDGSHEREKWMHGSSFRHARRRQEREGKTYDTAEEAEEDDDDDRRNRRKRSERLLCSSRNGDGGGEDAYYGRRLSTGRGRGNSFAGYEEEGREGRKRREGARRDEEAASWKKREDKAYHRDTARDAEVTVTSGETRKRSSNLEGEEENLMKRQRLHAHAATIGSRAAFLRSNGPTASRYGSATTKHMYGSRKSQEKKEREGERQEEDMRPAGRRITEREKKEDSIRDMPLPSHREKRRIHESHATVERSMSEEEFRRSSHCEQRESRRQRQQERQQQQEDAGGPPHVGQNTDTVGGGESHSQKIREETSSESDAAAYATEANGDSHRQNLQIGRRTSLEKTAAQRSSTTATTIITAGTHRFVGKMPCEEEEEAAGGRQDEKRSKEEERSFSEGGASHHEPNYERSSHTTGEKKEEESVAASCTRGGSVLAEDEEQQHHYHIRAPRAPDGDNGGGVSSELQQEGKEETPALMAEREHDNAKTEAEEARRADSEEAAVELEKASTSERKWAGGATPRKKEAEGKSEEREAVVSAAGGGTTTEDAQAQKAELITRTSPQHRGREKDVDKLGRGSEDVSIPSIDTDTSASREGRNERREGEDSFLYSVARKSRVSREGDDSGGRRLTETATTKSEQEAGAQGLEDSDRISVTGDKKRGLSLDGVKPKTSAEKKQSDAEEGTGSASADATDAILSTPLSPAAAAAAEADEVAEENAEGAPTTSRGETEGEEEAAAARGEIGVSGQQKEDGFEEEETVLEGDSSRLTDGRDEDIAISEREETYVTSEDPCSPGTTDVAIKRISASSLEEGSGVCTTPAGRTEEADQQKEQRDMIQSEERYLLNTKSRSSNIPQSPYSSWRVVTAEINSSSSSGSKSRNRSGSGISGTGEADMRKTEELRRARDEEEEKRRGKDDGEKRRVFYRLPTARGSPEPQRRTYNLRHSRRTYPVPYSFSSSASASVRHNYSPPRPYSPSRDPSPGPCGTTSGVPVSRGDHYRTVHIPHPTSYSAYAGVASSESHAPSYSRATGDTPFTYSPHAGVGPAVDGRNRRRETSMVVLQERSVASFFNRGRSGAQENPIADMTLPVNAPDPGYRLTHQQQRHQQQLHYRQNFRNTASGIAPSALQRAGGRPPSGDAAFAKFGAAKAPRRKDNAKWTHDLFEQVAREPEKTRRRFNLYSETLEIAE